MPEIVEILRLLKPKLVLVIWYKVTYEVTYERFLVFTFEISETCKNLIHRSVNVYLHPVDSYGEIHFYAI